MSELKNPIRVAVIGADGRMGTHVCEAVEAAEGLELVARIDQDDDLDQVITDTAPDVAVDFTIPGVSQRNVATLVARGVHAVVGTSGWTKDQLEQVRADLNKTPSTGVLVAPNFALGSVLASKFAAQAARFFESVEIIELHHPDKIDAPSGTATNSAIHIAEARRAAGVAPSPDATEKQLDGARGATVDGITVHSVRLRGLVAHEEILMGNPGEMLTFRHDSFDRISFMPGVILAVRQIANRPGLTVGLDNYLEL